jgi:radical SAM-linked protein
MAYTKKEEARYIAHLDLTRVFDRALRRAEITVAFSEGFNPHPKISFGPPLPVGVTGRREFVDIDLQSPEDKPEEVFLKETVAKLQAQLPDGIQLTDYAIRPQGDKALMAVINLARYSTRVPFLVPVQPAAISAAWENWLSNAEVIGSRFLKGKKVERNIRPFVKRVSRWSQGETGETAAEATNEVMMLFDIVTGNSGSVRPLEVLASLRDLAGLPVDIAGVGTVREGLYIEQPGGLLLDPIEILFSRKEV